MEKFVTTNLAWVYQYFDKNKALLEIFSFLMVAQSFIYGADPKNMPAQSVAAFKAVLWVMIFLIILLLQISTAVEVRHENGKINGTILAGANFMKTIMRLLTLVLLLATVPIFIKQIELSVHNSLFSVLYVSLGLTIFLELMAFGATRILPAGLRKTSQ